MARSRPRLSATARGLGHGHRTERQQALATMAEGQQCFRCELNGIEHRLSRALISRSKDGKRWVSPWLDLDEYPGRAVGGPQIKRLSGRKCNRSHGAVLGNQLRGQTVQPQQPWATSRRWLEPACETCGQPYRRAPRTCEICGAHYHPNYGEQRACGRVCGAEVQRRNKEMRKPPDSWPSRRIYVRPCAHCGELFTGRTKISRLCSMRCTWAADNQRRRGKPKQGECPCGVPLPARRKKCDDCVRDTKRQAKRREKARARERAKGRGAGVAQRADLR